VNRRAALSLVLVGVALVVGAVVALGLGAAPKKASVERPAPPPATTLSQVATSDELKLWTGRGCATCHGAEGLGTPMGPDVTKLVPLYLAKHGAAAAAKTALAAYLLDPQNSPKLRDDGVQYANPMPSILKFPGGKPQDADAMAEMLLRLAK
jgi:cytochrome c553